MDLVKGTTVLVVVLFHSVVHMAAVTKQDNVSTIWHTAMMVLEPMRMPLFFMVSGMLAAGAVSRPWRFSRRRTYGMAYLYVMWSAIFFTVVAFYINSSWLSSLAQFPRELLLGSSGYWYLYALLIYFVLAKVLSRWPAWIVIVIVIVPNLLRASVAQWNRDYLIDIDSGSMMTSIATNLVFYLIGAYCKELLVKITDYASWLRVSVILAAVIAFGIWRSTMPSLWEQTYLPISLAWIVGGVMAAHLLVQYEGPRRFGTFFGAHTLPIFVVQFPLLMGLSSYLHNNQPEFMHNPFVQLVFPIVVTTAFVAIALAVYRATLNNPGKYLFEAPKWVIREHVQASSEMSASMSPTVRERRTTAPAPQSSR